MNKYTYYIKMFFSRRAKNRLHSHLIKAKYFSVSYMITSLVWEIALHFKFLIKIAVWAEERKERYIHDYLYRNYAFIINKYKKDTFDNLQSIEKSEYPIFIYWDQGLLFTPPQVLVCINNIMRLNRNVFFIEKKTLAEYVSLPEIIERKREREE